MRAGSSESIPVLAATYPEGTLQLPSFLRPCWNVC